MLKHLGKLSLVEDLSGRRARHLGLLGMHGILLVKLAVLLNNICTEVFFNS